MAVPTFLLNPTFLLGAALLVGWGYTGWQLYDEKLDHAKTKLDATVRYGKLEGEFGEYKEQVAKDAEQARKDQEERDKQAREAARKTDAEHQKRLKAEKQTRDRLLASIGELRTQLTDTYAAKLAAEARAGDVARLATRAATAGKLLDACSAEYGQLAQDAERVRLQAIGLHQYIRDNRACSTPFDSAAP